MTAQPFVRAAIAALLAASCLRPAFAQPATPQSTTPQSATPQSATPGAADFLNAASDADNWILPAKSYANNPLTPATAIDRANVAKLHLAWRHEEKGGPIMTTPLVWHETMFLATADGAVIALDAANGQAKWRFATAAAGPGRLALFDGNVFLATESGTLIALDPATGHKNWEIAAAPEAGFATAPMPYHNPATGQDLLLIGVAATAPGGSGAIAAFAARDGHRLWTWTTIPGPGMPGHESWGGTSWRQGGATPVGIAISPATHTAFATLGGPAPAYDGAARPGDNLYSDALVALDLATPAPKLRGYHQFIAHYTWNWGLATAPMLVFGRVADKPRDLVVAGDKGGNLWVLDGDNGALLDHAALSFVKNGTTRAAGGGAVICPAFDGGIQSHGGAFDTASNTLFIASADQCAAVATGKTGSDVSVLGPGETSFNAIAVASGTFLWRRHFEPSRHAAPPSASFGAPKLGPQLEKPINAGVLLTASGLVFTAAPDGSFVAFAAENGRELWHDDTGAPITAPAIAYRADGKEIIAAISGERVSAFTIK